MIGDLASDRILQIAGLAAIFVLAALLLWETERRRRTVARVVARRAGAARSGSVGSGAAGSLADRPKDPGSSLLHRLGGTTTKTAMVGRKEIEETVQALTQAGLRGRAALHQIMGLRLVGLVAGLTGPVLWSQILHAMPPLFLLPACLSGALLGWRGPMIVIDWMGKRRRARLDRELPNAIDLLIVCGEAGLSIEAGVDRIVREMARTSPDLVQEFATVSAELRILPERSMAFVNLHERIRTDGARALATTLSQASRYGTPLGVALRVLSKEMRTAYQLRMEERAARLPVLITIPMIVFILPCVFIVTGGPAFLDLAQTFRGH